MILKCPACRMTFTAPDGSRGQSTRCAKCGHRFSVPLDDDPFDEVVVSKPPVQVPAPPPVISKTVSATVNRPTTEDRFPNLNATLSTLERGVQVAYQVVVGLIWISACALIVGLLSVAVADEDQRRVAMAIAISVALTLPCYVIQLLLNVLKMLALAQIETVKVVVQIERNTR